MKKKQIPFTFVLEALEPLAPFVKPMFGCYAVYVGERLVLFLYAGEKWPEQHGLWLPTTPEHYAGLAAEFPSAQSLMQERLNKSPWLLLPASAVDFETAALKACTLISQNDPRIGRIPNQPKLKPATARKAMPSSKRRR